MLDKLRLRRALVERGRLTLAEAMEETAAEEMKRWAYEQRQQPHVKKGTRK